MLRRNFLKRAVTGAAILPRPLRADPAKETIVVIGAGISGLAAARQLAENDFTVILLEARDRIGGRIHTDASLGCAVDLGASWIHGEKQNPVAQLAVQHKIGTVKSNYQARAVFGDQGRRFSREDVARFEKLVLAVRKELENRKAKASVRESMAAAVADVMQRVVPLEDRPAVRWLLFTETELEYAADFSEMSLASWDEDEEFEGDNLVVPEGYAQIVNHLARGLDIRLGKVVSSIEVASTGVTIRTNQQERFSADRCLVTLPLGVLKLGAVEFRPALPEPKRTAIRRLGAGRYFKLALAFDRPFWPEDCHRLAPIAQPHVEFWSQTPTHPNGKILVMMASGEQAGRLEAMPQNDAVNEAMERLRSVFGGNVPRPRGTIRSQWGTDPFARGAYSHVAPTALPDDFDALAEPISDRLYFAGEATSRMYSGTVHGALLSGRREANRIARISRK